MDARLKQWKLAADRLWSAPVFDHREAALLVADIVRMYEEPTLQHKAAQALPSLRAACVRHAARQAKDLGQRRFGAVRDCLHALSAPRFGKRGTLERTLTPDEHYRRMLGLPFGRRLFGPEINQAYKHAAKKVHPDAGGDERAFLELSAARDALMKTL